MAVFDILNGLNLNNLTESKVSGGAKLTYLSWPYAWAEVKKRYPDAHYSVWKDENGLPYSYDPQTGYMVYTCVEIEGISHEMWLPVMDSNNRAMKSEPYQIKFKSGKTITVEAATMFDINKTVMRCLVKNLAMFGLGLYIFAGEDLPEDMDSVNDEAPKSKEVPKNDVSKLPRGVDVEPVDVPEEVNIGDGVRSKALREKIKNKGLTENSVSQYFKKTSIAELTFDEWNKAMQLLDKHPDKEKS